jgi:hypothetical protein
MTDTYLDKQGRECARPRRNMCIAEPGYRWRTWDVVQGWDGGECGLDNYRTLCILCHKKETAKLRKKIAKRKQNV